MRKPLIKLNLLLLLALMAACGPAPLPTQTPIPATPSPAPTVTTPTALPTRAPLPSPLPQEERMTGNTTAPRAQIRVVHAAPNLQNIDVYLDNQTVAFGLRYPRAGGQATIPAGDYTLRLKPAGASEDVPAFYETPLSLIADQPIIVTLAGDEDALEVFVHTETNAPVRADEAAITVIHAVPGAPETTVLQPGQFEEDPLVPAFNPIGYGEQSALFSTTAGGQVLQFTELLNSYPVTLTARRNYTLIIAGDRNAPDVISADVVVPVRAEITFVNVSQAIGQVDVYLDGELAVETVFFKNDELVPGAATGQQTISIYEAGADPETTEPLLSNTVSFPQEEEVFLILMGPADDLTLISHVYDGTPTNPEETQITLINALAETPLINESLSSAETIRIAYAQPVTRTYTARAIDFEFTTPRAPLQDDFNVIEFLPETFYEAGRSYLIFITGQGPDNPEPYTITRSPGTTEAEADANNPAAGLAQAYLVNATDQNIQARIDGTTIAEDLALGEASALQLLEPSTRQIALSDANSQEPRYNSPLQLNINQPYSLVYYGQAGSMGLGVFPIDFQQEDSLTSTYIRLINATLGTTRELAFAYMPAVEPERRLSNVIDSPTDNFPLPPQVPRLPDPDPITGGNASQFYPVVPGTYDIHIYDPVNDRLYASAYDVTLSEDTIYDVILYAGDAVTPLDAFVTAVPLR